MDYTVFWLAYRVSAKLFCCVITDITVGYEKTTYTTIEGIGFVELCIVITNPLQGIVAPRRFVISATTADETAGRETASILLFPCRLL